MGLFEKENMDTLVLKSSPRKKIVPKGSMPYPLPKLNIKKEPMSPIKCKTEDSGSPLKELRNLPTLDISKLKCPMQKSSSSGPSNNRRNTRERNRMKVINTTFVTLQKHLPTHYFSQKKSNKISKVDILRSAINYINILQDIVENTESAVPYTPNSMCSDYQNQMNASLGHQGHEQQMHYAAQFQHLADCISPTGLNHLTAALNVPMSYADSTTPPYQMFSPTESGHVPSPMSSGSSDTTSQPPSTPCEERTMEYVEWV